LVREWAHANERCPHAGSPTFARPRTREGVGYPNPFGGSRRQHRVPPGGAAYNKAQSRSEKE